MGQLTVDISIVSGVCTKMNDLGFRPSLGKPES